MRKTDDGNNKTINGIKGVKRRSCQNNLIATRPRLAEAPETRATWPLTSR